jgi:hypothetical protein
MDVGRPQQADSSELMLMALFAHMDTLAMSIAASITLAVGLAAATAALLLWGAPLGVSVGPNLSALGNILPGYSVTWLGCAVGAAWAGVIGAVVGFVLATAWNFGHLVVLAVIVLFYRRSIAALPERRSGAVTQSSRSISSNQHLLSVGAQLNLGISALCLGLGFGLLIFSATYVSVAVSEHPGRYLNLLGVFMPGYSASPHGAWLGLLWGMFYGGFFGGAVTALYERTVGASLPEFVIWDEASVRRLRPPMLRFSSQALGLALGAVVALQLVLATWWLVLRGTADESVHAKLLSYYLPGYTVGFQGGLVGALELFLLVYLLSSLAGGVYNLIAKLRASKHE